MRSVVALAALAAASATLLAATPALAAPTQLEAKAQRAINDARHAKRVADRALHEARQRARKGKLRKVLDEARRANRNAELALEGAGGLITSDRLAGGAVTAGKIAPGAIDAPSLFGSGVVGLGALAPDAVEAGNIGAGAVGAGALAPNAVGASNIGNGAVGAAALGPNAVEAGNIADGAVGTAAIGVVPAARATFSANQNIPDDFNSFTTVDWDEEVFDTQALHSGSSPNLTAPAAGIYQVTTSVEINTTATGDEDVTFFVELIKNAATDDAVIASTQNITSESDGGLVNWGPIDLNATALVSLDEGDTASVDVQQSSSAPTNIPLPLDPGDQASSFEMAWVGPQTVAP